MAKIVAEVASQFLRDHEVISYRGTRYEIVCVLARGPRMVSLSTRCLENGHDYQFSIWRDEMVTVLDKRG